MERATPTTIRATLEALNAHPSGAGAPLALDHNAGGWRVTNATGSRDISPRLSARDMLIWLDGFGVARREASRA